MIQQIAERLVHAFDQSRKRLGRFRFAGVGVVVREPRVGMKRGVHGVVRHVQIERLARA